MTSELPELLTILKDATNGLQWMSESDYPFEVFHWQNPNQTDLTGQLANKPLTNEAVLQQTNHPSDSPIETTDLDTFFAVATEAQDWQSPEEKAIVHQYQKLVDTLKQHLTEIKVYRIGRVNIDIYIVGKTGAGNLVGLSTKAVET